MDFASLIKAARERDGLSQSQAASVWGVSLKTLQAWEQGVNVPGGQNVAKLLPFILPSSPDTASRKSSKKG